MAHESGFLGLLKHSKLAAERRINAAVRNGVVSNSPVDDTLDASLLMLPILRYPGIDLNKITTEAIAKNLRVDDGDHQYMLYRYRRADDFGNPEDPFLVCSFWLAQAYARINQKTKGVKVLKSLLSCSNHLGLYSEHISPSGKMQLGNFPQTYSHVGLVNAAFEVSPSWQDVL